MEKNNCVSRRFMGDVREFESWFHQNKPQSDKQYDVIFDYDQEVMFITYYSDKKIHIYGCLYYGDTLIIHKDKSFNHVFEFK